MKKRYRLERRVDPEELNKQTAEIDAKLKREAPRMHAIATYLEWRTGRNGFGTDFEFTLRPKETY